MDKDFVHLHLHSELSLLDGINKIEEIPKRAKAIGQKSIACTDHGNVGAAYRFFQACNKEDIKPIIGMEAYWTPGDKNSKEKDDLDNKSYHILLLALDNEGLHNLFKLSSIAYTGGAYIKPPRIDDNLLEQYSKGLCATTACLGSRYNQLILNNRKDDAVKLILKHRELFNKRFLIEVEPHTLEDQLEANKVLLEIARTEEIPLIYTQDCHYTQPEDKYIHELALCIQTKSTINSLGRFTFGEIEVHIGDYDYMWERAQQQNIPHEALSNTVALAKMVNSDSYFSDIKNRYPKFQDLSSDITSWDFLEQQAEQGLYNRFGETPPEEYKTRLNEELKIIKKMGFSDYMLIVEQILADARELEIIVGAGRGSASGSLVAYALKITEMDPIKYGLLFSRFLNEGRSSTPLIFSKEMLEEIKNV